MGGNTVTYDKDSFLAGLSVGMSLRYSKRIPKPTNPYLTFSSSLPFTIETKNLSKNWDGIIEWSSDAISWFLWDGATTLSSNTSNSLLVRGIGNTVITGNNRDHRWVLNGNNINCLGNIECLLDYQTVANGNHPNTANYAFAYLFSENTDIISAPSISSVNLSQYCFVEFCSWCANLKTIPKISQTEYPDGCFQYSFWGCSKLKLSTTQTIEYQNLYRIPNVGTGTKDWSQAIYSPFYGTFSTTGGTFKGTPDINTTYYTSNTVIS